MSALEGDIGHKTHLDKLAKITSLLFSNYCTILETNAPSRLISRQLIKILFRLLSVGVAQASIRLAYLSLLVLQPNSKLCTFQEVIRLGYL